MFSAVCQWGVCRAYAHGAYAHGAYANGACVNGAYANGAMRDGAIDPLARARGGRVGGRTAAIGAFACTDD